VYFSFFCILDRLHTFFCLFCFLFASCTHTHQRTRCIRNTYAQNPLHLPLPPTVPPLSPKLNKNKKNLGVVARRKGALCKGRLLLHRPPDFEEDPRLPVVNLGELVILDDMRSAFFVQRKKGVSFEKL
jgi:hypothetical protein